MIQISKIEFGDTHVTIEYVEERDVHPSGIIMFRRLVVPHGQVPDDFYEDLADSVRQIVDNAAVVVRNPPSAI